MQAWRAVLLLTGFLAAHPGAASTAEREHTIRFGYHADRQLLDPVFNDCNTDIWILTDLHESLVLPTEDERDGRPVLASAWATSEDGLALTFRLRDAIRFSEGRPSTADEFEWLLTAPAVCGTASGTFLSPWSRRSRPAPASGTLNLWNLDPSLLGAPSVLTRLVMPKAEVMASAGTTAADNVLSFSRHPITSGQYTLESWARGAEMNLARNLFYWPSGSDEHPLLYLNGIQFKIVSDDVARILEVQLGELDGAEFIPFPRVAERQRDAQLLFRVFPVTRTVFANLNGWAARPDGSRNPLRLPLVRVAIYRDGLIRIVTLELGTMATSFFSRATPLHVNVPDAAGFDPADARRKLAAAACAGGFYATMLTLAGNEDEIEFGTCLQKTRGRPFRGRGFHASGGRVRTRRRLSCDRLKVSNGKPGASRRRRASHDAPGPRSGRIPQNPFDEACPQASNEGRWPIRWRRLRQHSRSLERPKGASPLADPRRSPGCLSLP